MIIIEDPAWSSLCDGPATMRVPTVGTLQSPDACRQAPRVSTRAQDAIPDPQRAQDAIPDHQRIFFKIRVHAQT